MRLARALALTWTTRDGRVIKVEDLETDHLANIVAMLRRKGFCTMDEFMDAAAGVNLLAGEYAQMAAEEAVAGMKPVRILKHLEDKLRQRRRNGL